MRLLKVMGMIRIKTYFHCTILYYDDATNLKVKLIKRHFRIKFRSSALLDYNFTVLQRIDGTFMKT